MLEQCKKAAFLLLISVATVTGASPLFDGSNADLWLIDKNTGAVTGYNYDTWLESFAETALPLDAGEYAIVNNTINSSQLMTPGQPLLSIAGLEAGNGDTSDSVQSSMLLEPATGTYKTTINARILIDKSIIEKGGATLNWVIDGKPDQSLALEPALLGDAVLSNGYYVQKLTFISDAKLTVILKAADATVLSNQTRSYTILSDHVDGIRRDTDGDGLPDVVEVAIGLDALNSDWQYDSDNNGWSDFDEWLRSADIDPGTGMPRDTDNDGWSDFDELLRGTNPNDPQAVLPEPADSELYYRTAQRYKDYPAVRRLYEVEHLLQAGNLNPIPAVSGMVWSQVRADDIFGQKYYDSKDLLRDEEITSASIDPADISARLRSAVANVQLTGNNLPTMRLPAGDSMVVTALHEIDSSTQVYKYWLKRQADLTPLQFYETVGVGSWNTADEWKAAYIAYLGSGLVQQQSITLDRDQSTVTVNLLEAFISHEARLHNRVFADIQLFGNDASPVSDALIRSIEEALKNYPAVSSTLDDLIDSIVMLMGTGQPLYDLENQVIAVLANPLDGLRTDQSVADNFIKSFDESSFECYIESAYLDQLNTPGNEDALAAFNAECPAYSVVADPLASETARLQAYSAADQQRLYLLRLLLIPDGKAQYLLDQLMVIPTLQDMALDTDVDGADNRSEIFSVLADITLPWSDDSDGDGLLDGSDNCPLDMENTCSATPVLPSVITTDTATVYEPVTGQSFVLLSFVLDKPSDNDVIIHYQTQTGLLDMTASPADFTGISDGQVVINAGDTVALIKVFINADSVDEGEEQFLVSVTSVENATLSMFSSTVVSINDPLPSSGNAPAVPTLTYKPVKEFQFSWSDVSGATFYRLLENADGASGFIQVGSDIAPGVLSVAHTVPLYARTNAEYVLQHCDAAGCTDTASLSVSGNLAASVGYFKSSNPWSGRKFGNAVSLSADGLTMAVGTYDKSDSEVIVFSKQTGTWLQQARFVNPQVADYFGYSVSLSDDGNTLAVGAYNTNNSSALDSGAVYVYTRTGDVWSSAVLVKADNVGVILSDKTGQNDFMGFSVSLSGDGNTLAAGAYQESSNATGVDGDWNNDALSNSGAVYVFRRSGGNTWTQSAYVKADNTGNGDNFGYSVDLNKDGTTLAVGARFESSNATTINGDGANDAAGRAGAAYIFTLTSGWAQQAYIKATNTGQEGHFGYSVALSDDGDTLAVGANNNAAGSAFPTGFVYIFTRSSSNWSEQAFIKPDFSDNMAFGDSVSLSGDGNILAVGASREKSNAVALNGDETQTALDSAGAAFVYTRSSGSWSKQTYVKATNTQSLDYFGRSVSISADGRTLAVGAPGEDAFLSGVNNGDQSDNTGSEVGAVYVY